MKEILERIGLIEFFAYVCPGAILLSSLALWEWPDFDSGLWKREVLVIFLGFTISYTLGLILASFNHMAQVRYPRSSRREQMGLMRKIWTGVIRFLYRFPSPGFTPSIIRANLRIAVHLERLSGLVGLSNLATPWDRLVIYRTLMADALGEKCRAVLKETDNLHRRFRFCMGVALAVFLLAFQSGIRLIFLFLGDVFHISIINCSKPNPLISYPLLVAAFVFGIWASIELRQAAIRMWELERYLTASLTLSRSSSDCVKTLLKNIRFLYNFRE